MATFDRADGQAPTAALTVDANGNLFGTTTEGGDNGDGTVFELTGTGFVVPEPSSVLLLGTGGIAIVWRRRR